MASIYSELVAPNGRKFVLPTGLFINNQWVRSNSGNQIESIDPSNEQVICSVDAADSSDVDIAVKAARTALADASWSRLPAAARGCLLHKLADLVDQHKDILATIETWDNGKPYSVSFEEDIPEVVACLRYYAGYADKVHGTTIPTTADKLAYTLKQPVGVCAQIIPWNYPLVMASWKLGPALATGNTVVLKPAESTPLSALYLATLIQEAGFPRGVVNILNGFGNKAGEAMARHQDVDKIAFTGSTVVGQHIMRSASCSLKNITLETGGKSPLVVFGDANVEQAVKWAFIGGMSNQGQVCTATSRLLVHSSIEKEFLSKLVSMIDSTVKVGDPFCEGTTQGPQVSRQQFEKLLGFMRAAEEDGAVLECGGRSPRDVTGTGKGFFISPTIFSGVSSKMRIFREEAFGPVMSVTAFDSDAEALQLANDSVYGLAAAIFTQNIERAHKFSANLQAGMVWVNSSNDPNPQVPFGGMKQSGIGRELGEAGLEGYLETKSVHLNIGSKL